LRNLICWSAFLFACLFAPADQRYGCSASSIGIEPSTKAYSFGGFESMTLWLEHSK
jgi:hypothetical protein